MFYFAWILNLFLLARADFFEGDTGERVGDVTRDHVYLLSMTDMGYFASSLFTILLIVFFLSFVSRLTCI